MRKGRPKKLPATRVVHLTVDTVVVDALDAWVEEIKGAALGSAATRTTLVRDLLRRAVDAHALEKKSTKTPPTD